MDSIVASIVIDCFLAKACDIQEYLVSRHNMDRVLMEDTIDDISIRKLIAYVDGYYLGYKGIDEIIGMPSPIIKYVDDRENGKIFYDPCCRYYSKEIYYPCHEKAEAPLEFLSEFLKKVAKIDRKTYSADEYYLLLTSIFEDYGSMISINGGSSSLFELAKLSAGISTILYYNRQASGIEYGADPDENQVIACSFDFLGIKDFKFKGVSDLRRESAASLFMDLLRENVLDEFFSELGVSRANLIFSGGRHLHMYLPNTKNVHQKTKTFVKRLNDWLVKLTGDALFVSYGIGSLSSLEFGKQRASNYYFHAFTEIANQKALMESHKYSAMQIQRMNSGEYGKDLDLDAIINFFPKAKYYVVSSKKTADSLEIISGRYVRATNTADYRNSIRVYVSNYVECEPRVPVVKIWHQKLFDGSVDLRRGKYVLLRLDIDGFNMLMLGNPLGKIFPHEKMEMSKHLAFFLKRDVPILIERHLDKDSLICAIHEGADDLFVLMSESAMDRFIQALVLHYQKFTGGCLSFSAGISEFEAEHDFAYNCNIAQYLMDQAKKEPGKNTVALKSETIMMKWKDYLTNVENS